MNILPYIHNALGIFETNLTIWHLILRGLVVYILGILLIRLNKRFMGYRTVSNFFLYIIIGSILATAIVGPLFYQTLGMATFLFILNWIVVKIDFYTKNFKIIREGEPLVLIEDGKIRLKALQKCLITEKDLHILLRTQTGTTDLTSIKKAYFENSGQVSFIFKKS
ncbi:MAG: DUF421 domain-containing protein [Candidatus Babeliaceae bacterium]|nr:DUF421 domain-containing protein [Candidatus Babeliaceae bacterium]